MGAYENPAPMFTLSLTILSKFFICPMTKSSTPLLNTVYY